MGISRFGAQWALSYCFLFPLLEVTEGPLSGYVGSRVQFLVYSRLVDHICKAGYP